MTLVTVIPCAFKLTTSSLFDPMVMVLVPMVHRPVPAFIKPFTEKSVAPGAVVLATPLKIMVFAENEEGIAPVAKARS